MCLTVLQRDDKTGKENQREGVTLRAHRGREGELHVSVEHTKAEHTHTHKKKSSTVKVFFAHNLKLIFHSLETGRLV